MKKLLVSAALAAALTAGASVSAEARQAWYGQVVTYDGQMVEASHICEHYFHHNRYGHCVSDFGPRHIGYGTPFDGGEFRGYSPFFSRYRYWR